MGDVANPPPTPSQAALWGGWCHSEVARRRRFQTTPCRAATSWRQFAPSLPLLPLYPGAADGSPTNDLSPVYPLVQSKHGRWLSDPAALLQSVRRVRENPARYRAGTAPNAHREPRPTGAIDYNSTGPDEIPLKPIIACPQWRSI